MRMSRLFRLPIVAVGEWLMVCSSVDRRQRWGIWGVDVLDAWRVGQYPSTSHLLRGVDSLIQVSYNLGGWPRFCFQFH